MQTLSTPGLREDRSYYLQIRQSVLRDIQDKRLTGRIPAESELCRRFGVSRITVRKALESLVEQGVIVRKRGKGSFVRAAPQGRPSSRRGSLALVLPAGWNAAVMDGYLSVLIPEMISAGRDEGLDLQILNFTPLGFRSKLDDMHADLSLWISPEGSERDAMAEIADGGSILVAVNRALRSPLIHSITCDHEATGRLAAEHLLAHGHRRIGFVGSMRDATQNQERLAGFMAAYRERGLRPDSACLPPAETSEEELRPFAATLLRAKRRPTALFAAGAAVEPMLLEVIAAAGLKMPDDVSIVGSDDLAGLSEVQGLTVVAQPYRLLARMAVRNAVECGSRSENTAAFRIVLQPALHERRSVRSIG
jgi:GntR family transcriptional regulator, arabinose operon transcriptional repressor